MHIRMIVLETQTEVIVSVTEAACNDATDASYLRLILGCN